MGRRTRGSASATAAGRGYNASMESQQLEDLARRHGILLLLQFGSTVSGRARADSDLDLAVLLDRAPAGLTDRSALIGDLQALSPDPDVDVAQVNRADPLLLKKITERCTLLYGSPRRLHELKVHAFRRYQDHRRYLALERDYVAGALRTAAR